MSKPNFLIVMTDHQRGDTVCPSDPCITPNVEGLAEQGVSFTETYVPMAHCCPSRATFLSGLYPSRHGVWNNVDNPMALSRGLADGVRLFSEDLRDAGYNLAYSGKWHVSAVEGPSDRGWVDLDPRRRQTPQYAAEVWEQLRRAAKQPPPEPRDGDCPMPGYQPHTLYFDSDAPHGDERVCERAIEALPGLAQDGSPWCLFVSFSMPHAPYRAPHRYVDLYDPDGVELPESFADTLEDKPNYYRKLREMHFAPLGERKAREAMRRFWAMCTYLDDLFGRVLSALEATGQVDDTVVLYTSDHGDYNGDHGLFHKGVPCFKGAYHVPAVVRWPAGLEGPGRTVDELVSFADFAPTFLELAGVETDRRFTGKSLAPLLRDETPAEWRDFICTQCDGVENYFTQRSIWTKEYKYTYNGFDFDEFYDLRKDPHEMVNRFDDPHYREVIRDLCRKMWRFACEEEDHVGSAHYVTISTAAWGPLEALKEDH